MAPPGGLRNGALRRAEYKRRRAMGGATQTAASIGSPINQPISAVDRKLRIVAQIDR